MSYLNEVTSAALFQIKWRIFVPSLIFSQSVNVVKFWLKISPRTNDPVRQINLGTNDPRTNMRPFTPDRLSSQSMFKIYYFHVHPSLVHSLLMLSRFETCHILVVRTVC